MISANDVTFIVPIYKLGIDRLNNLKFILPHIIKTGARVLVVEQVKESATSLDLKEFNSEHLLYVSKSEEFHKTGIINWAVKNHANTKYVWVNDVDFYMKFNNVLGIEWTEDFIKPYSTGKKLTSDDSTRILRGEKLNVSYEDESAEYISLYGALSFIFEKNAFLNIGGMDESLFGWVKEDIEFDRRLKSKNIFVQEMDHKGIHLWHTVEIVDVSINNKPTENTKDMAIIACHFNWCGFKNPVKNLNRFLNQMEVSDIPVYGVELSLTTEFVTKNRKNWKHITVSKENICFQKEACINLVEKTVPKFFTKIAWIDTDLYFTNQNWYQEASKKLDKYKIVQLYSQGCHTNNLGEIVLTVPGVVSVGGPAANGSWNGHPGGALAARRDLWSYGGLYVYSPMGASDTIFMNTIYGVSSPMPFDKENNKFVEWKELKSKQYLDWKTSILSYVSPTDISYVDGKFIHEWHGERTDRNYNGRNLILEKLNFDKNVKIDDRGLLEFVGVSQEIHAEIYKYFNERNEDGVVMEKMAAKVRPMQDMAVVCCLFNWQNFISPRRNLLRFLWQMETKKIAVYGIELSTNDNFITKGFDKWIKLKVSKKNICFQKEACINLIEKFIPEQYTKIAWIDPDFLFENDNWYHDASIALDKYKVIQLFDSYIATDRWGVVSSSIPSMVAAGGPSAKKINPTHSGQPGAAWASRRDLWTHGGLYPYSFMGGGDSAFVYTIYEETSSQSVMNLSGIFDVEKYEPYINWKKTITPYVNKEISFITGKIRHEWHGDSIKRNYANRYDIVKKVNFKKSLRLGKNGLIEIVNVDNSVYNGILNYFKSRDEDGIKL